MFEFNLHKKTLVAYASHRNFLVTEYRSLNDDHERLWSQALSDVCRRARGELERSGKKRITVQLNLETATMLYHHAFLATSEIGNIKDLKCFPIYKNNLKPLRKDLENIVKQCEGKIKLTGLYEPRLAELRKEIASGCKIISPKKDKKCSE